MSAAAVETRERPVLFSAQMVRAILGGSKTQTRRVVNPHTSHFGSAHHDFWHHAAMERAWADGFGPAPSYLHVPCHRGDSAELDRLDKHWAEQGKEHGYRAFYPDCGPCEVCDEWGWRMTSHRLHCRFNVGDRLWVRETLRRDALDKLSYASDMTRARWSDRYISASGLVEWDAANHKRRSIPSIHMPRWASRLTLEVTDVRVQRLQSISEEDASAEGMHEFKLPNGSVFGYDKNGTPGPDVADTAIAAFAFLWERLNAKRGNGWDTNPWVWVIGFRRVE